MAIVITEMLGTDAFTASRSVINANFLSLKAEVETIESMFGLSLTAGNIDVSAATGGSILGRSGGFNTLVLPAAGTPTLTFTGSTGAMTAVTGIFSTSITTPAVNISTSGALTNAGTSTFTGTSTFNGIVYQLGGLIRGRQDVGTTSTHTVLNSNSVIVFECSTSPATLVLTADPALIDKHVITFVKRGSGVCSLDTTDILGFSTGSIDFSVESYKSSITLQYDTASSKWMILSSSNMTIA